MMTENKKKLKKKLDGVFRKGDVLIFVVLIAVIIVSIVFMFRPIANSAEIYVDGQLKYILDLSQDKTVQLLDGKMTVQVSGGKIFVKESDCKEQLCVHSAPITNVGGMIVCLPNKVIIKVSAREVDAIT